MPSDNSPRTAPLGLGSSNSSPQTAPLDRPPSALGVRTAPLGLFSPWPWELGQHPLGSLDSSPRTAPASASGAWTTFPRPRELGQHPIGLESSDCFPQTAPPSASGARIASPRPRLPREPHPNDIGPCSWAPGSTSPNPTAPLSLSLSLLRPKSHTNPTMQAPESKLPTALGPPSSSSTSQKLLADTNSEAAPSAP